jgi:hypothetical protein
MVKEASVLHVPPVVACHLANVLSLRPAMVMQIHVNDQRAMNLPASTCHRESKHSNKVSNTSKW